MSLQSGIATGIGQVLAASSAQAVFFPRAKDSMQVDAINGKKDELTIAIKGMTDLTKQLVRVYAEQAAMHPEARGAGEGAGREDKRVVRGETLSLLFHCSRATRGAAAAR